MRSLAAVRALLRVELRQTRRNAGRSWLVILLVAVPVAAMVGGSALLETVQRTPDEARAQVMGAADLRVEDVGLTAGERDAELRALLPVDARVGRVSLGRVDVRVPGRKLAARLYEIEAAELESSGLARGMLLILDGAAPTRRDEIALSPVLARGLARTIGDTVEVASGSVRIAGIVVDPENLEMPVVLRAPDASATDERSAGLVAVGDPAPVASELRARGWRVSMRSEIGEPDEFETIAGFVLGGFGFFEAALVISAAFAVGLRRRQREIGLLGAQGAPVGVLRASLLASALALASVGVAIGVAVGIGAAHALHPFFDEWNLRWNGDLELSTVHMIGAVILGLCAALLAATLPAFGATRLPIRVALTGRRPITEGTRVWSVLGIVLVASGSSLVAWGTRRDGATAAVSILAGSILGVLGLGACSPWLLGNLARVAAPLPLAWRLAARDAGRFRARNGPVVTAVLAGMSVSLMFAALIGSIETLIDSGPESVRRDQLVVDGPGAEEVARTLSGEFDAVALAPLSAARVRGELVRARSHARAEASASDSWIAVSDHALLRAFGAEAGLEAFDAGRLVAVHARESAAATVASPASLELVVGADRKLADVDVAWIEVDDLARSPTYFAGAALVERLGLDAGPPPRTDLTPWIVRLRAAATPSLIERAQDRAATLPGTTVDAALLHHRETGSILLVVLALCFLTGIVVVFVATALSSVESAADAHVLRTVGAAPSLLRTHVAARAGYLALLGCVLAIPAGLIPSYGLVELSSANLVFAVPWTEIGLVVVGMPALAFGGAWGAAALERPTQRVRAARG